MAVLVRNGKVKVMNGRVRTGPAGSTCCCQDCPCPDSVWFADLPSYTSFPGTTFDFIVGGVVTPTDINDFGAGTAPFAIPDDGRPCADAVLNEEFGTDPPITFYEVLRIAGGFIEYAILAVAENVQRGGVVFYGKAPFTGCCDNYLIDNQYGVADYETIVTDPVAMAHSLIDMGLDFTAVDDFIVVAYDGTVDIEAIC